MACWSLSYLLLFSLVLNGEALECYTCVGKNDTQCNQQGWHHCPDYADACASVMSSSPEVVIKSCSPRSVCLLSAAEGSTPSLHCCYYDRCNEISSSSHLHSISLTLPLTFSCLLFIVL